MEFKGAKLFRYRVLLSVLLGKEIRIKSIRRKDYDPGVRDYEVSLL